MVQISEARPGIIAETAADHELVELARARNTRDHDNRVAGNRQIDMAEVVFMSIADFNRFRHDRKYRKRVPKRLKNSEHLDRNCNFTERTGAENNTILAPT